MWREGLLGMAVLRGETVGYKHHPQLMRFKAHPDPYGALTQFMHGILEEARARNYNYDASKIPPCAMNYTLPVTRGQVQFELSWIADKLQQRGTTSRIPLRGKLQSALHPLFRLVDGEIEPWEKSERAKGEP